MSGIVEYVFRDRRQNALGIVGPAIKRGCRTRAVVNLADRSERARIVGPGDAALQSRSVSRIMVFGDRGLAAVSGDEVKRDGRYIAEPACGLDGIGKMVCDRAIGSIRRGIRKAAVRRQRKSS